MIQTEKYGTPLASALRVLSAEFRNERMMRAEEKAARLPAIMTVPLILFILPTLFIVILGPAACSISDNLLKQLASPSGVGAAAVVPTGRRRYSFGTVAPHRVDPLSNDQGMRPMLHSPPTSGSSSLLVFVLGLLVGGFLFAGGGRKWKARYHDEVDRREAIEREHREPSPGAREGMARAGQPARRGDQGRPQPGRRASTTTGSAIMIADRAPDDRRPPGLTLSPRSSRNPRPR